MQIEWFKFDTAWHSAIKSLSDEETGRFIKAVYNYVETGVEKHSGGREDLLIMIACAYIRRGLENRERDEALEKAYKVERSSREVLKWRNEVLARDNYKCVRCGSIDDLNVHHIQPWKDNPSLRSNIENGITLCGKCHREIHSLMARLKEDEG